MVNHSQAWFWHAQIVPQPLTWYKVCLIPKGCPHSTKKLYFPKWLALKDSGAAWKNILPPRVVSLENLPPPHLSEVFWAWPFGETFLEAKSTLFCPRALDPLEELPKMNGQSWASAQKGHKTSRGLMGSQKKIGQNIGNHRNLPNCKERSNWKPQVKNKLNMRTTTNLHEFN
jgi:hypothetical protein